MFRNGIGLRIVCANPFEIFPIWLQIYIRNVRLYHWPIFTMVVSLAPYSFRDMPPPALRGFELLHVEYLIGVQLVGLMVPWRFLLVLTWVSAWYLHLLFPVWVPLKHELNMRNEKCVSYFLWYVHFEVDLKCGFYFCGRVLCNITRRVVQYLLHINVHIKYDVSLPCLYFQYIWLGISEWADNGIKWGTLLVLKDIF